MKLAAALCVSCGLLLGACGGAGGNSASAPVQLNPTKASVTGPVAPSPRIAGDYDADDEYRGRRASDADNDDRTAPSDPDDDADATSSGYYDTDDRSVRQFGPAAGRADRAAIGRLIKRYFDAAAAGDGGLACSLLTRVTARSLPAVLGGPSGPPYAHGATCAAVATTVFDHYHRQLTAHAATLSLGDVRVRGAEGEVVLAFEALAGRQIDVLREEGVWRVAEPLDRELP